MTSLIEIHTLLQELTDKKTSPFFVYNEIKNILLDQRNFDELEQLLAKLIKELNTVQKENLLPYLCTTSNATLNRYALYELSSFITPATQKAVLLAILDPLNEIPADTFLALREHTLLALFDTTACESLLHSQQFEKLALFSPEIRDFAPQTLDHFIEVFKEQIPKHTSQTIHGVSINTFDLQNFLCGLDRNI